MLPQVSLTILALSLTLHKHECSIGSKNLRQKHYNGRGEPKLSRLIKQALFGTELCLNKSKHFGISEYDGFFKAVLLCTINNRASVVMIIRSQPTKRTTFVTVLNKGIWTTCLNPICSVTHVCNSLDEHDCKPVKKESKNKKGKSNVSLKNITYITTSSRYNDIIFGQGPHLEQSNRILSFNVTNNFTVREHVLINSISSKLTSVAVTAGMTTGPCYTGHGSCVYMCYRIGKRDFRLCVFREPNIEQGKQYVKSTHYGFGKTTIVSIAVTTSNVMYSLSIQDTIRTIKAVRIFANDEGRLDLRFIKEWTTFLQPSALDITKDGSKVLLDERRMMYLLTPDTAPDFDITHSDLYYFHEYREINQIVCWLHDGKHALFMNKQFPYKATKVSLVRR